MATNRIYGQSHKTLTLPVPAETSSGDPLVIGELPCVAVTDRVSDAEATVQLDGVFHLEVTATAVGGGVAVGDPVYFNDGDLTDDAVTGSNPFFGYALAAITADNTETIRVQVGR